MKRLFEVLLLLLLVPPVARTEPPPRTEAGASAPTKWTVDDVLLAESAADFQISPDGRWAVWVKTAMDSEKGEAVAHLVRSSLTESRETQLTRGTDSCHSPRWSPDGKLLAFLSARPGPKAKADDKEDGPKAQLWLVDPTGGEPWQLTDFPRGVTLYDWAGPDSLVFAAQEKAALHETARKKDKKDDSAVVEDEQHEPPVRLFKVAVASKKVTRLTGNGDRIQSLAVSPDGRRAVTINERSLRYVYDQKIKPAVFLTDLETGERKPVFTDPALNIQDVRWALDGKGFYATDAFSNDPRYTLATVTQLHYYDLAAGAGQKVELGWDKGLSEQAVNGDRAGVLVTRDGFVALLADGARNKVAIYTRTGLASWKREELTGEHVGNVFGLQLSSDGKELLYAHSSTSLQTQWYRARLDGSRLSAPAAVTALNPGFKTKAPLRAEVVRWKGALGETVEGILFYPQNYKTGTKYPLVVSIHGGPFSADFDTWFDTRYGGKWRTPIPLLTQRGAFVLEPNYHGSSNYGLAFAESIARGKYYDLPVEDIERGVDALIGRGLVDRDRLGCMGWSNGAILTAALIAHTTRFRAASAGAGGAEWVADWGACEFGDSLYQYYFGKSPLEDPQLYIKMAPLYQFDRVRTPTLLFQGDADRSVPPHHAWTQYRALQQLGKAEVRLVFFPEAKHLLTKLAHQRRKVEEELRWFDRHLFQSAKEEDEAVKPDSPLARALRLRRVRRDGDRYGVRVNDRLIPETVRHAGLEVGRFEVTAAQFAEFDRNAKVEPGKENYPAHGVTFAQAQAYCRWLSELTGKTYRLPTEAEGEELYGQADGAGENTLDYWAGYAVNPDDAARLRAKLKDLGGSAPLLREVGGFKGAGDEEPVFDLGGNVAEWVVRKDGKGRPAGGSAATAADVKPGDEPPPEYVGFRVVLGPAGGVGRTNGPDKSDSLGEPSPVRAGEPAAQAGEAAKASADAEKRVDLTWGMKIPMRDDVKLNATVYKPQGIKEALPVIFTMTPYISDTYHDRAMYFSRNGYVFALVDVRGRGNSGGTFEPFANDGRDGHDVVEWLAKQPWCNGKVAMWGGSYAGFNQWATLKEFPPHLTTIVPAAAVHPGVDYPATNNIFSSYEVRWLTFTSGVTPNMKLFSEAGYWTSKYRQRYEEHTPFRKLDTLVGNPSPHFQKWIENRRPGEYLDAMAPTPEQYARIDVPVLTITGHYDDDQPGAMTFYRRHMQHGSEKGEARHYLLMGPWDHAGTRTPAAEVGGLTFGKASLLDLNRLHKEWYDWTMKGGKKPAFLEKRVAYYVTGTEEWRFADSLEAIPVRPEKLYLTTPDGPGHDAFRAGVLSRTKPGKAGPAKYVYDPLDLREMTGPSELEDTDVKSNLTDQRLALELAGNGLLYHSEPLAEAAEVAGYLKLLAWVALDVPDTDFAVNVFEIKRDGTSVALAEDRMRARYRESLRQERLAKPGEINRYEFQSFNWFARRLEKGSRLRLVFYSPNSRYWEKNYNSGGEVADESRKDARTAHVTLHQDAEHPSYLEIPTVAAPGHK